MGKSAFKNELITRGLHINALKMDLAIESKKLAHLKNNISLKKLELEKARSQFLEWLDNNG